MIETNKRPEIRRILVAVDSAAQSGLLCEAAMQLAAELRARLHAMFIEDLNLLYASALPFVHEISLPSAALLPFNQESVERALRTTAEGLRRLLAETGNRFNIEWTFDIRRERYPETLVASLESADLLLIGPRQTVSGAPSERRRKSQTASAAPIVVVYDRQPTSQRALEAAMDAQSVFGSRVIIAILAEDPTQFEDLRRQAAARLGSALSSITIEPVGIQTAIELLGVARRLRPRFLFVGADSSLLHGPTLRILVDRSECPIAIVR